jgi:hypothetical protein
MPSYQRALHAHQQGDTRASRHAACQRSHNQRHIHGVCLGCSHASLPPNNHVYAVPMQPSLPNNYVYAVPMQPPHATLTLLPNRPAHAQMIHAKQPPPTTRACVPAQGESVAHLASVASLGGPTTASACTMSALYTLIKKARRSSRLSMPTCRQSGTREDGARLRATGVGQRVLARAEARGKAARETALVCVPRQPPYLGLLQLRRCVDKAPEFSISPQCLVRHALPILAHMAIVESKNGLTHTLSYLRVRVWGWVGGRAMINVH